MFVVAESRKRKVMPGDKHGLITVLGVPFYLANAQQFCVGECECGTVSIFGAWNLIRGNTYSCGCESSRVTADRNRTHGLAGTRLYSIWCSLRARCTYPSVSSYRYYGARGIGVCDEWQAFEPFHDWAITNGYSKELSIDRINVNGDYEPANCRWATGVEQSNNRRSNARITAFGEEKSAMDWSRDPRCAVMYGTIIMRLHRGWDGQRAISEPVKKLLKG